MNDMTRKAHTRTVLRELPGLTAAQIIGLEQRGIMAAAAAEENVA